MCARADYFASYSPKPLPGLALPCSFPDDWDLRYERAPLLRLAAIAGSTGGPDTLPPHFGLIGHRVRGRSRRPFGVDLTRPFAAALFGTNRSGKSYAKAALIEMLLMPIRSISRLRRARCVIAFHCHPTASYPPELLTSVFPNLKPAEAETLLYDFYTEPTELTDVVVLAPLSQVARLRRLYPHVQVLPIEFPLRSLGLDDLRTLLGLSEKQQPLYARQVERLLRELYASGEPLTFRRLIEGIKSLRLDAAARRRLLQRLELVRPWVNDRAELRELIRPGRLILVDLRDPMLDREKTMDLCALLSSVLALHPDQRREEACDLVLAYDEAHKFMGHAGLRRLIVTGVRERRHLHLSVLLASQDPQSLPEEVLPLLDMVGVFQHGSQEWNKHLGKHIAVFRELKASLTAKLPVGTMIFWAKEWIQYDEEMDDPRDTLHLIEVRPRVSYHGGDDEVAG
jgi:hypothetical protein